MMKFEKHISSRDELIAFSRGLGEVFKSCPHEGPWLLGLGAGYSTGKSLVALGIDQAFHPERYKDGIPTYLFVDHELRPSSKNMVWFCNFRGPSPLPWRITRLFNRLQDCIGLFAKPEARVLIASNVDERLFRSKNNLGSLDIKIRVYMQPSGDFSRRLDIKIENPELIKIMRDKGLIENESPPDRIRTLINYFNVLPGSPGKVALLAGFRNLKVQYDAI